MQNWMKINSLSESKLYTVNVQGKPHQILFLARHISISSSKIYRRIISASLVTLAFYFTTPGFIFHP